MFESKNDEPLTRTRFFRRMALSLALAGAVVAVALGIGVLGYHFIAGFGWTDSFLEASMIATGMGPVGVLTTRAAKLFAAGYALVSGLLLLTVATVTLAPVIHRLLHKFHVDDDKEAD